MALKPKPGAKPAAKTAVVETAISTGRTVTLERGFTIQTADGQWAKASVSLSGPVDEVDDIREQLAELASAEVAASIDQLQEFSFGAEAATEDGAESEAPEGDEEGAAEDDDAIGPDQINEMKRPELLKLITENGLGTDPDDHPKNPAGLKSLRAAIIEEAFSGDDEDGVAETDSEGDDTAADDGEEITVEDVKAMDRPTLIELIETNELPINHAKLTKLADLKAAVIEAMLEDGDEDGDEAGDDAAADDGEEGYTEEALQAMGLADLKAIYVEWDMGKFPTGSPIAQKKLAVKAILKAQEG